MAPSVSVVFVEGVVERGCLCGCVTECVLRQEWIQEGGGLQLCYVQDESCAHGGNFLESQATRNYWIHPCVEVAWKKFKFGVSLTKAEEQPRINRDDMKELFSQSYHNGARISSRKAQSYVSLFLAERNLCI